MDGGSQDSTVSIAGTFTSRIPGLKIYAEKDDGIYDAMNKAVKKATGTWLFFMGSDDRFYDPNVLEQIAKAVEDTPAKVVYGDVKIQGDTGWAKDGEVYAGEFDVRKLLNQNICHQAMFYHRDFVMTQVGDFNLKYDKSSDWDFNLRCWAKQPFVYVNLIVAYFVAGGFSTHSNDTSLSDDYVDNVLTYFDINPFHPLVNTPSFAFYGKVIYKQQQDYPIRYTFEKLKNRIKKKLGRT